MIHLLTREWHIGFVKDIEITMGNGIGFITFINESQHCHYLITYKSLRPQEELFNRKGAGLYYICAASIWTRRKKIENCKKTILSNRAPM